MSEEESEDERAKKKQPQIDYSKIFDDKIAGISTELAKIPARIYECEERLRERVQAEVGGVRSTVKEAEAYMNTVHSELESYIKKRKKEKLEQVGIACIHPH